MTTCQPPAQDAADRRQGLPPVQQVVPFRPPVPAAPQSILLVDDETLGLSALREMLYQICGPKLRLRHCTQGLEALEVLRRRRFDLVMIDYWLPDMDGLELVSAIADMADDTAVVLMAHGGSGSLGAEAMYRGARHFVDKDCLEPELLEEVILQAWNTARLEWNLSRRSADMHLQLQELRQQLHEAAQRMEQLQAQISAPPDWNQLAQQFQHLAHTLQRAQKALEQMG